jgi:hypothetical protein
MVKTIGYGSILSRKKSDIVYINWSDNIYACKMMARVSVPFTVGHYYDRGERPNTELADNSPSVCRK